MPFALINQLNLYYEVHGEGIPVVIISGISMNSIPWTLYQIPTLTSAGFQVIVIDNRDVGQSDDVESGDYSIHDMALDVSGLLDKLNIRSAHILGYSMGGMIGLDLAIHEPEKVSSLSFLGSIAKLLAYERQLLKIMKAAKQSMPNEEFWRFMGHKLMTWRFFENQEMVDRWFSFVTSDANHQSAESLIRQAHACENFDVSDSLDKITLPTHVIVGEEDQMLAPRHSEALARDIPNSKLTIIPNAGHSAYAEAMPIFNESIMKFWHNTEKNHD